MTEKKLKREFEYKLLNPISLHKDGQVIYANKILLKAPSMVEMRDRCILKQIVLESLQKQSENAVTTTSTESNTNSTDSESTNGDQFISMIYMNQDKEKLLNLIDAFTNILATAGRVDDEKITDVLIKQIDPEELDAMLGEYILNFILPSWMKRAMNI